MKIFRFSAALIIGALSLTSCATIFTGTSDAITFNSTPEGANAFEAGIEQCTTPVSYTHLDVYQRQVFYQSTYFRTPYFIFQSLFPIMPL